MTLRTVIVAVLAALALAILAWQLATEPGDHGAGPMPADAGASRPVAPPTGGPTPAMSMVDASRTEIDDAGPFAGRAIDRLHDLHGVVLDPDGVAVPGAEVRVLRADGHEYGLLDVAHGRSQRLVERARADNRGAFVFRLPRGRPFVLEVSAARFALAHVNGCYAGQRVTVRLRRGAVLFGRVTRAEAGEPVVGAMIRGRRRTGDEELRQRTPLFRGETDGDGRFRFADVPPGPIDLDVWPVGAVAPRPLEIDLVAGEEHRKDLQVEAGTEVRGRVFDAVTKRAIEGAEVAPVWTFARVVTTDREGRYVFAGLSDRALNLEARAPGYGRIERRVRDRRTREVERVLDFELMPARRVRGQILGPDGRPLEAVYVAAVASDYQGPGPSQRTDWQTSTTDGDGGYEIADLRPDMRHFLFAKKAGYGTVTFDFPASENDGPLVDLGAIHLERAATVTGVVVDDSGAPVADHTLTLRGGNADRDRLSGPDRAPQWLLDGYVAQRRGRTDDLGRFAFTDLAAGSYVIVARLRGSHTQVTVEVTVPAGQQVDDLRLVLPGGLEIAGRVTVTDGGALPKVYLSIDGQDGQRSMSDVELGPSGVFTARGLLPGRYRISAYPYQTGQDKVAGRRFATLRLGGVQAGARDVLIELKPAVAIAGQLVDAAGVPVAGGQVLALDAHGQHLVRTSTGDDGRFEMSVGEGTVVTLEARAPRTEGEKPEPAPVRLQGIAAGTRGHLLKLPP